MGKLFVLMGKSSSGKDTIYKRVIQDKSLMLNNIVIYTTRPIREGECEGNEYHFVSEERMKELDAEGKIVEHRSYHTVHGIWHYFTVNDGQVNLSQNSYIMIGTLESYQQLRKYYGEDNVIPIYIAVDDGIRLERAMHREKAQSQPKYAELCRRYLADEKDFSEENLDCLGIKNKFNNIDVDACVATISSYIKDQDR